MKYRSQLTAWDIRGERVILRADLNIPTSNGVILNDLKLQAIQPTLDYLISQGSIIVLLTHIGNPDTYTPALSTRLLIPWMQEHGYKVEFSETIEDIPSIIDEVTDGTIILCENMRFFKEELTEDLAFAHQLKQCGDFYVNDGFACMHRTDTSITLLAKLFAPEKKSIGFYTEKELISLDHIMHNAQKPLVMIMGGKKIKSKMPYLYDLLDIVNTLVICPALTFTFLKSQGFSVGASLVDDSMIQTCKDLYIQAKEKNVEIILPSDVVISLNELEGPYEIVPINKIPDNATGISIGTETNAILAQVLQEAHTIIYNGAMGFLERPETLDGMHLLLESIARSKATTLIAGGDSVATVYYLAMQQSFTHLSLGGGATLFYITHKTLPALQALSK